MIGSNMLRLTWPLCVGLALTAAAASPTLAQATFGPDSPERIAFDAADTNHDGKLSLAEVQATQAQIVHWTQSNAQRLPDEERQKLVAGLLVVQMVGPDQLFASYDTNHDGSLTLAEVTADIRLDKRPLPEILSDPSAIDWNSLAARAGSAAPLLKKLLEL